MNMARRRRHVACDSGATIQVSRFTYLLKASRTSHNTQLIEIRERRASRHDDGDIKDMNGEMIAGRRLLETDWVAVLRRPSVIK